MLLFRHAHVTLQLFASAAITAQLLACAASFAQFLATAAITAHLFGCAEACSLLRAIIGMKSFLKMRAISGTKVTIRNEDYEKKSWRMQEGRTIRYMGRWIPDHVGRYEKSRKREISSEKPAGIASSKQELSAVVDLDINQRVAGLLGKKHKRMPHGHDVSRPRKRNTWPEKKEAEAVGSSGSF